MGGVPISIGADASLQERLQVSPLLGTAEEQRQEMKKPSSGMSVRGRGIIARGPGEANVSVERKRISRYKGEVKLHSGI